MSLYCSQHQEIAAAAALHGLERAVSEAPASSYSPRLQRMVDA